MHTMLWTAVSPLLCWVIIQHHDRQSPHSPDKVPVDKVEVSEVLGASDCVAQPTMEESFSVSHGTCSTVKGVSALSPIVQDQEEGREESAGSEKILSGSLIDSGVSNRRNTAHRLHNTQAMATDTSHAAWPAHAWPTPWVHCPRAYTYAHQYARTW